MDRPNTMATLRRIEAQFAPSPPAVGDDARNSIRAALAQARENEPDVVATFQVPEVILVDLFFLLCDRYGLQSDAASKRSRRAFHVVAPRSFLDKVFSPLFEESSGELLQHLIDQMHALLHEAYGMTSEGPSVTIKPRSK
jgi:hypothetical protein